MRGEHFHMEFGEQWKDLSGLPVTPSLYDFVISLTEELTKAEDEGEDVSPRMEVGTINIERALNYLERTLDDPYTLTLTRAEVRTFLLMAMAGSMGGGVQAIPAPRGGQN